MAEIAASFERFRSHSQVYVNTAGVLVFIWSMGIYILYRCGQDNSLCLCQQQRPGTVSFDRADFEVHSMLDQLLLAGPPPSWWTVRHCCYQRLSSLCLNFI